MIIQCVITGPIFVHNIVSCIATQPFFVVQKIGKENKFRVDDCFSAMVKHWVKQGTPTWSELAEALVSNVIGRQDIADTIQLQYKVEKAKSPKNGTSIKLFHVCWLTACNHTLLLIASQLFFLSYVDLS